MRKVPQYAATAGTGGRRISQITLDRFDGGLNQSVAPQANSNESIGALNVDFLTLGGVARRKAIGNPSPSNLPTGQFDSIFTYDRGAAGVQVLYGMRSGNNTVVYETTTPSTVRQIVPACQPRAITMNNKCYIVYGTGAAATRWDGATMTALNATFADDSTNLPHGSMPRAKCIAVHQRSAWVANIVDPADGVAYPNRVRWSWPDQPEDWPSWAKENIDVGQASDEIVALVPHNERLLVFKRNSVYAIHGEGPDNYRLVTLAQNIGASSPDAVVRTDEAVYFFDMPNGAYRIGPTGPPQPIFEKVRPSIDNGNILPTGAGNITASWVGRRVFFSVPWLPSATSSPDLGWGGSAWGSGAWGVNTAGSTSFTTPRMTFIFDYVLKCWTTHDYGITCSTLVRPDADTVYALAAVVHPSATTTQRLGILESTGDYDWGSYSITGAYQTPWLDANDAMLDKRWRRIGLLFSGTATMNVEPRTNYSRTSSGGGFAIAPPTGSGSNIWGSGVWGTAVWTSDFGDSFRTNDGKPVGLGRSMSAVISNTSAGDWVIGAVYGKYIPRRRRD